MSIPRLSGAAEDCIQIMSLHQEQENTVRECVEKYSTPNTFFGAIIWVANRVINAVKSIFGNSDWQIAEKLISDRIIELATERGLIQENPQNQREITIRNEVARTAEVASERLLITCFEVHEMRAPSTDQIRGGLESIGVERLLRDMRSAIDRLF